MSRKPRANSFLLEPERFRYDRAVLAMSNAARGCYAMLFMAAWSQEEPGVLVDDDQVLANLAMTSIEEWVKVRPQVAAAFDATARPGFWIQRGMLRTVEAQDKYINRKRAAGSKGGKAKRDNRLASTTSAGANGQNRSSDENISLADGIAPARDRFGSVHDSVHDSENLENLTLGHPANGHDQPNGQAAIPGIPPHDPDDVPPEVWFDECFWPEYPRKVKKPDAKRAVVRLFKATAVADHDRIAQAVLDGLERYKRHVSGKEAEFISHPGTWIRNRRWEDESW